ncbi:GIP, partial [Symbiodinium necroappetens]
MGPKADRPETVKPGITDLPRLPEYQPMTGSIDLLNWLTHIQPIMEDLSDTSYAWWEGTLQDAAVEALRKWTLWRRRASSIGIAEPDASVLIQGLDRITTKVVKANSELSFRVSLIRSTLQAEMEQQARLSVTQGPGGHAQRKVEFVEGEGEIRAKVLQVLSEVQHLPMVKSLMDKIREWMSTASPSSASKRLALLDSGATHVLRAPTTSAEWELAREVKVQLAGDSVMAMKQNEAGSLLTGDQLAQVIVPLGKVIQDLGYRLLWTSEVCELVGPQGDVLPLTIRNGCPEVSEKVAYHLIQQLEAQQLPELEGVTQASISAIAKLKSSWWSYLKEYVKTGDVTEAHRAVDKAPFFDYKDAIKEQMITRTPREGIWNLMKSLRVN